MIRFLCMTQGLQTSLRSGWRAFRDLKFIWLRCRHVVGGVARENSSVRCGWLGCCVKKVGGSETTQLSQTSIVGKCTNTPTLPNYTPIPSPLSLCCAGHKDPFVMISLTERKKVRRQSRMASLSKVVGNGIPVHS